MQKERTIQTFEFELAFTLPKGEEHDMDALDDIIWEIFPEDDPLVGLGRKDQIGVMLELKGESAEDVIIDAAKRILEVLPEGSELHEIHPDLVSLQEVAAHLKVTRQTLRTKDLPAPYAGGLYRLSEISECLHVEVKLKSKKDGRYKMSFDEARGWLNSCSGAQKINGLLAAGVLDRKSLKVNPLEQIVAAQEMDARD